MTLQRKYIREHDPHVAFLRWECSGYMYMAYGDSVSNSLSMSLQPIIVPCVASTGRSTNGKNVKICERFVALILVPSEALAVQVEHDSADELTGIHSLPEFPHQMFLSKYLSLRYKTTFNMVVRRHPIQEICSLKLSHRI